MGLRISRLLVLPLLLFPVAGKAVTRHVSANGGGTYATIQAAIDASSSGDTVLCSPGVYSGPGNFHIRFNGTDLVLLSSAGPEETIIDCEGEWHSTGLIFFQGESRKSVVDGFTIRRCYNDSGGGIYINGTDIPTSVTLSNLIIEDCTGNQLGGGGGGIFALNSSFRLSNSIVRNCLADQSGGGIYSSGPIAPELSHILFEGNVALSGGGGLSIHQAQTIRLENLVFRDNWSTALTSYGADSLFVENVHFDDNQSHTAGMRCNADYVRISRCSFTENYGRWNNGMGEACEVSGDFVEIVESTFAYNNATAISIRSTGAASLRRLAIAFNFGEGIVWDGEGEPPTIECVDAWENAGGNYGQNLTDPTGTDGNISAHPLFCGGPGGGDPIALTLHANSPCLPANNECGVSMGAHGEGCATVATADPPGRPNPRLLQNHPNPFNPATTIRFALPEAAETSLSVCDISGRLVARLINAELLPAGLHAEEWDGRDDSGRAQSAGTYLLRLEAAGFRASAKMLLLK